MYECEKEYRLISSFTYTKMMINDWKGAGRIFLRFCFSFLGYHRRVKGRIMAPALYLFFWHDHFSLTPLSESRWAVVTESLCTMPSSAFMLQYLFYSFTWLTLNFQGCYILCRLTLTTLIVLGNYWFVPGKKGSCLNESIISSMGCICSS